jgi:hypothetical protein
MRENNEDILTSGLLIKWGGISFATISFVVSIVWFIASIKADILTIQQQIVTVKNSSESRDILHERDLDRLREREDSSDKAIAELVRKVDVAVAILERLERRTTPPP